MGLAGAGVWSRCRRGAEAADAATPSCTLTPELTEGPYYLDLDKVRRDVTEGKPGLRLDLRIKVVNARTGKPLENAAVEIWHADAGGTYSGFAQEGTAGKTYLRGVQLTGQKGVAQFRTLYPGWYQGRAIHIHLKVHVGGREDRAHRAALLQRVGQRPGGAAVALQPSPAARACATARTTSTRQAGSGSLVRLRRRKADSFRKGLIGTITVGVARP